MCKVSPLRDKTPYLPFPSTTSENCADSAQPSQDYQQYIVDEGRLDTIYSMDNVAQCPANGTQIVPVLPESARSLGITREQSCSLAQLLLKLSELPLNKLKMLRTVAAKIAECAGRDTASIDVRDLSRLENEFDRYLTQRRYPNGTARTYRYHAHQLQLHAMRLGLVNRNPSLGKEWQRVYAAAGKPQGIGTIIQYAIRKGKKPAEFCLDDLRCWVEMMQRRGRGYQYVDEVRVRFRGAMRKAGFDQNLCDVFQYLGQYGVKPSELPSGLHAKLKDLVAWKQLKFVEGRRRGSRHRPVSGDILTKLICRLYGYAVNIRHETGIVTFTDLITKGHVLGYLSWMVNDRGRRINPLKANLALLASITKHHPDFKSSDFDWLTSLVAGMEPDESEEVAQRERKCRQSVPYDELAKIPIELAKARQSPNMTTEQMAWLVHDELAACVLVQLAWRQKNIRECKIGVGENIFKDRIPVDVSIAKPVWVEQKLKEDPQAQFWQYKFTKKETKCGNEVHVIFPRAIALLLEEYVCKHRPIIVLDASVKTLFVQRSGKVFTDKEFTQFWEGLTFRYVGKAVNPHLVRDIDAYKWLDEHPNDYLTLMKILWHRNIKTTIDKYGRNYNESNAVCRMEEWVTNRSSRSVS